MTALPWHVLFHPCGACKALVNTETGCKHWQPARAKATAATKRAAREKLNEGRRNDRARQREMVEEFRNMLGRQT